MSTIDKKRMILALAGAGMAAAVAVGCMLPPQPVGPQQGGPGQIYGEPAPASGGGGMCPAPDPARADPQLMALLTRNAWCSFSYQGGTTRTSRVVFDPNGMATQGSNAETSHSGNMYNQYGDQTAAWGASGQTQGGRSGCWRLDGTTLMLSADGQSWAPQPMQVTQNSNGYPIIQSGGQEFSTCQ